MATSELFTACLPSRPAIPMPTCAAWIMGTSFAPSPMASVTGSASSRPPFDSLMLSRTRVTISAFCSGETRQAITMRHVAAMSTRSCFKFVVGSMTTASVAPVTIRAVVSLSSSGRLAARSAALDTSRIASSFANLSPASRNSVLSSFSLFSNAAYATVFSASELLELRPMSSTSNVFSIMWSGLIPSTFALRPMLRAVSSLSPVSTQSLTPALRMFSMASGTLSWSLSSIAVAPTMLRSFSINSATSAIAFSLFSS
mmetsp:Transcript_51619/g.136349  ORF Transcript_51619/g.136349 Transcript_51619/m.136349 type:complete len:257 (+) Transcript_51619:1994-2764(+)